MQRIKMCLFVFTCLLGLLAGCSTIAPPPTFLFPGGTEGKYWASEESPGDVFVQTGCKIDSSSLPVGKDEVWTEGTDGDGTRYVLCQHDFLGDLRIKVPYNSPENPAGLVVHTGNTAYGQNGITFRIAGWKVKPGTKSLEVLYVNVMKDGVDHDAFELRRDVGTEIGNLRYAFAGDIEVVDGVEIPSDLWLVVLNL